MPTFVWVGVFETKGSVTVCSYTGLGEHVAVFPSYCRDTKHYLGFSAAVHRYSPSAIVFADKRSYPSGKVSEDLVSILQSSSYLYGIPLHPFCCTFTTYDVATFKSAVLQEFTFPSEAPQKEFVIGRGVTLTATASQFVLTVGRKSTYHSSFSGVLDVLRAHYLKSDLPANVKELVELQSRWEEFLQPWAKYVISGGVVSERKS